MRTHKPLYHCGVKGRAWGVTQALAEGGWHWAKGLKSFFLQAMEEISGVGSGNGKWFPFSLATVVAEHRK